MRDDVVPYVGPAGRVIVYDTYANDRSIHFDVMLPYSEEKESDLNRRALGVAKTFLEAMGADPSWVQMSGCSRCHIDELERYEGKLWHVPKAGAWLWPLEGCPKPTPPRR
jgi:hypothetical protein